MPDETPAMKTAKRQCGDCSLCCKVMAVEALNKPAGQWCAHFARGQGCTIHGARPAACRAFDCHWLLDETMGDEWYPRQSGMVVQALEMALLVRVDPGTQQPWRHEPYLSKLVFLAGQLLTQGRMVLVLEQGHTILLLPDRIVDVGILAPEDQIALRQVNGAGGAAWAASMTRRDGSQRWLTGPISAGNFRLG